MSSEKSTYANVCEILQNIHVEQVLIKQVLLPVVTVWCAGVAENVVYYLA